MADEETLQKVREAFDLLMREGGLGGWRLDGRLLGPFSQELRAAAITVSLPRGESECGSVVVDPDAVKLRAGEVTASGPADEIRRALREKETRPGQAV